MKGFDLRKDEEFERLIRQYNMVQLGQGCSRTVYGSDEVPFVVKEAAQGRKICNKVEADQYKMARALGYQDYVARVWAISDSGKYLMMERVRPFSWGDYKTPEVQKAADELGTWDTHLGNMGVRSDGTVVLIDLGHDGPNYWDD